MFSDIKIKDMIKFCNHHNTSFNTLVDELQKIESEKEMLLKLIDYFEFLEASANYEYDHVVARDVRIVCKKVKIMKKKFK